MKEKIYNLKLYGEKHRIVLAKTTYSNNGTIAILMLEKMPDGTEEEWGTLTVNLQDQIVEANKTSAYIDTNNLGNDIIRWLVDNDIATITPFIGFSGYCSYPYVMFHKTALANMRAL